MSQKHLIEIDEYQRDLLTKLIQAGAEVLRPQLFKQPGNVEMQTPFAAPGDNAYEEAVALFEMMRDIPKNQIPTGDINSFCS